MDIEKPCYAASINAAVWKHGTLEAAREHARELGGSTLARDCFLGWICDWQLYRAHNPHKHIYEIGDKNR